MFISNINNISKPNTIIIIIYLNGKKIQDKLKNNKKIEIYYQDKLYWAIYPFNDNTLNKVLFFIRDANVYNYGVEEELIFSNQLIGLFKNFKLINKISFLENNIFNKLESFQKQILSYYEVLVFQKN